MTPQSALPGEKKKKPQNPQKPLFISTKVWERAQERAEADGITISLAFNWLLKAYVDGSLGVPLGDTALRDVTRKTHNLRPESTILAAAEKRAKAAGFRSFSAFAEMLLDDYGQGTIVFTPLMLRR